jgi:hypothetical protein
MAFFGLTGHRRAQIPWNLAESRKFGAGRRATRALGSRSPLYFSAVTAATGARAVLSSESELCRRIGPHRVRHVAIELEGGLDGIVSPPLAHRLDVDAGFEKQRGVGVP